MSAVLFLLNVLATLCFARSSLEVGAAGKAFLNRIDSSASGIVEAVSRASVSDVLEGLTYFAGAIALQSFICLVIDLYFPLNSDLWRTYWQITFSISAVTGIAITWITKPHLLNQPILGFSIWFPIVLFALPAMDLVTGTSEASRALAPIGEIYNQHYGIALPQNAWAYAAGAALPMMAIYLALWVSMTVIAWVAVVPMLITAYATIKLSKWSAQHFPKKGLTPLCFLLMVLTAAYSWSW